MKTRTHYYLYMNCVAMLISSCGHMLAKSDTPVLTIGTNQEKRAFAKFYKDEQFENLVRPVDNSIILTNVCRKLNLELTDIPVIFLTGISDGEHIKAVLKLKPQGYLLKPAAKNGLLATIRKTI